MKKWTLGLLALVFLALCACSAADAESTAAGIYLGQTVKLADADWVPVDAVYDADSCRLGLNSCGEGFLWLDGERSAIRWSQSGGHLTLKSGRQRSEAELQDGIITAQLFASEIWMCFVREDLYQPPESTSEPEAEKEPDATSAAEPDASGDPWSFWYGDWYGWYAVTQTSEDLADWQDSSWDVCAHLTAGRGDTGSLRLWDTDNAPGEALGTVKVGFAAGITDAGCMESKSGTFLGYKLSAGDWSCDPAISDVSGFHNMICIAGTAGDKADAEGWFSYRIYLRPWGTDWSDVRDGDCSEAWYTDMLPPGYESWYLPLLRLSADMPPSFQAGEQLLAECSFCFSSKRKPCLRDCYPVRCKRTVSGWRRRRHSDAAHSIRSANAAENRFLLPARFGWCAGHCAFLRVARSGRKSLGSGLPFLAGGRRRIAYHRFYGRTPERRRNGSRKGLARWHELERRTRVSDRQ